MDPRDTLEFYHDFTKAGKNYLLGLNFCGEEARVYTYKVLRRGCVQVGTPFKVEALRDSVSFVNVAGTDYVLFSFLREEADLLSCSSKRYNALPLFITISTRPLDVRTSTST